MSHPDKSSPAGAVSQNLTATQTQTKRKRGAQKGNHNARKHGFYSATLTPAEASQLQNITTLEGLAPEIACIRVKLQSCLEHDPDNRRVIREASRLLAKRYSADYGLDPADHRYLRTIVENLLEMVSLCQSPRLPQTQRADQRNESYVP